MWQFKILMIFISLLFTIFITCTFIANISAFLFFIVYSDVCVRQYVWIYEGKNRSSHSCNSLISPLNYLTVTHLSNMPMSFTRIETLGQHNNLYNRHRLIFSGFSNQRTHINVSHKVQWQFEISVNISIPLLVTCDLLEIEPLQFKWILFNLFYSSNHKILQQFYLYIFFIC